MPGSASSAAAASSSPGGHDVAGAMPPAPTATFIAKLYRMVEEEQTNSLIRWSPTGDSFIVTRIDAFAKLVLPQYFKHNNFSSFVRQLNMYGFRKVPHVHHGSLSSTQWQRQQMMTQAAATTSGRAPSPSHAMLRHESPDESDDAYEASWEFSHEYFKRGRTDWLPLMKRKGTEEASSSHSSNQPSTPTSSATPSKFHMPTLQPYYPNPNVPLLTSGATPGRSLSSALTDEATGQVDLSLCVSELAAIRRQQAAITSSMMALERDQGALWEEMASTRAKYDQQQAVIERILGFLSILFNKNESITAGPGGGASYRPSAGELMVRPTDALSALMHEPYPMDLQSPSKMAEAHLTAQHLKEKITVLGEDLEDLAHIIGIPTDPKQTGSASPMSMESPVRSTRTASESSSGAFAPPLPPYASAPGQAMDVSSALPNPGINGANVPLTAHRSPYNPPLLTHPQASYLPPGSAISTIQGTAPVATPSDAPSLTSPLSTNPAPPPLPTDPLHAMPLSADFMDDEFDLDRFIQSE